MLQSCQNDCYILLNKKKVLVGVLQLPLSSSGIQTGMRTRQAAEVKERNKKFPAQNISLT